MKTNWKGTGLLAACVLAICGSNINASVLTYASGNTQPYRAGSTSGTVDFAVYSRSGGSGDVFGTGLAGFDSLFTAGGGSGGFDTSAQYLYVYESVANGPEAATGFWQNTVAATPSLVTSFGSFAGAAFSSDVLGVPAGFANPSSASLVASPVVLGGQSGLQAPTVLLGSTSLKAYFFAADLTNGARSTLWGYTSNAGPAIASTAIIQAGGANGTAVTASLQNQMTPEPSTFSLIGLGLAAAGLATRRFANR